MKIRILTLVSIPAALSLLSCGDATPPPPEGTVTVTIQNSGSATAGYGCGASHVLAWGGAAPSPTDQGITWVDGQDGHDVECSVSGSGTFNVSASITGNGSSFSITGTVAAGGTGTAAVYLFDSNLAVSMSDTNCTLRVDSTGSFRVEKGAIWGAVSCSRLTSNDDNHLWCALNSTIVFKSCST